MAVQAGFVAGPILGSLVMQYTSFQTMSLYLGLLMVFTCPVLLVNRNLANPCDIETKKLEEKNDGDIEVLEKKANDVYIIDV